MRTPPRFEHFATVAFEDPDTMEKALKSPDKDQLQKAMKEKLELIENNTTWTKTVQPPRETAVPWKVVFRCERDDKGNVYRFKARLVAKGLFRKEGIHYSETVAPFEVLLLLAIKFMSDRLHVYHADISTTFLNGDVYGKPYESRDNNDYNLKKSLYILKQFPRLRYEKLKSCSKDLDSSSKNYANATSR